MPEDARGLELTTPSDAAALAFDTTLQHSLEYRLDTPDLLAGVFAADPDFPMAHCLKGLMLLGMQSSRVRDDVAACLAAAEAGQSGVTERERGNIAALRAMYEGDRPRACAVWEEVLVRHPTDLLALRQLTFAHFWSGQSFEIRDAVGRVLHAWDESLPGYGNVLGMYAFGLEESADYARAEAMGRRAVELNRDDLWAVHAVAHTLEMQGRLADGVAWLSASAPDWADRNPFQGHLWWHLSLFQLERGEYAQVLQLYDESIRDPASDFYIQIQNAASLLWRLEFLGVDVGGRWVELADTSESRIGDIGLGFTATHDMIALAMDGREAAAARLLESLREHIARSDTPATRLLAEVTLPLCEAIRAFGRKDYARAFELMNRQRHAFYLNGASHAQRDVYTQAWIESAIRTGDAERARALLAARLEVKPHGCGTWRKYAATLNELGDTAASAQAEARAGEYAAG